MPRANRYFLANHVWHLTHRCHEREFLLMDDVHVLREPEVPCTVDFEDEKQASKRRFMAFFGRDRMVLKGLRWSDPNITFSKRFV